MIPLAKPDISAKEIKGVVDVLESGILSLGQKLKEFEQQFSAVIGTSFAVGVNSGTSGLHLCIKALGIKDGDEVITTPFSFVASANCILYERATPVFVDVEEDTFNINPDLIEKAITPRTKAILIVHVFGQSCDMDKIVEIARKHNLKIIEDACEALFGSYRGRNIGTFGDAAVFAFYPNKQITTGEGGMIVTDNQELCEKLRPLKDQGRPTRGTGGDDLHNTIGYNFKMTDLQAGLGLGQLEHLEQRTARMKRNYQLYKENLRNIKGLSVFSSRPEELPQWTDILTAKRDALEAYLKKYNMHSRKYWLPLHRQLAYKLPDSGFPNSARLSPQALWLPSAFTLSDRDVLAVCKKIKTFFRK